MARSNSNIQFHQYNPTDSFDLYLSQFNHFHNVIGCDKKSLFLSVIGTENFELLTNLIAPQDPANLPFEELCLALKNFYSPKLNPIVQRYKFNKLSQMDDETIDAFTARLKGVAIHCEFGSNLESSLRDRFVAGLKKTKIVERLLGIENLTWQIALDTSRAMERAELQSQLLNHSETIHLVKPRSLNYCYSCGGNHNRAMCKFRTAVCFKCQKKGHIGKICKSECSVTHHQVNYLKGYSSFPTYTLKVNDLDVNFEIDTGSSVTMVNGGNIVVRNVSPLKTILKSYNGTTIPTKGKTEVTVSENGKRFKLPLIVSEGHGHNILGRDWLQHFPHILIQLAHKWIKDDTTPSSINMAMVFCNKCHLQTHFVYLLDKLRDVKHEDEQYNEIMDLLVTCLRLDNACFKKWQGAHQKYLNESCLFLSYLHNNWSSVCKTKGLDTKLLLRTIDALQFDPKMGEGSAAQGPNKKSIEKCNKYITLLKKKRSWGFFKMFIVNFILLLTAATVFLIYDTNRPDPENSYVVWFYDKVDELGYREHLNLAQAYADQGLHKLLGYCHQAKLYYDKSLKPQLQPHLEKYGRMSLEHVKRVLEATGPYVEQGKQMAHVYLIRLQETTIILYEKVKPYCDRKYLEQIGDHSKAYVDELSKFIRSLIAKF